MTESRYGDPAAGNIWQTGVLEDLKAAFLQRSWCRGMLLRGSLAQGSQDADSDIDLVVTVDEKGFETALQDLSVLPSPVLPPWLDTIVRDFGGVGFVFLLQVAPEKWGQIDIYFLPHGRRQWLLDNEPSIPLWTSDAAYSRNEAMTAQAHAVCLHFAQRALQDLPQAVLGCYVALFLLRKRIVRHDRLQAFADTYAAALSLRTLISLACSRELSEWGWRAVPAMAEHAPDPEMVLRTMSAFTQDDVFAGTGLRDRVAGLQDVVAMLAPAVWREHGESFRALGRYLGTV
jgi:hypothetical protein